METTTQIPTAEAELIQPITDEPTIPVGNIELTPIEKLQKELADSQTEYHEKASSLTLSEIKVFDAKHKALRDQICDYYAQGATKYKGWQAPRGMQKNPTTVEVYAFWEPQVVAADTDGNPIMETDRPQKYVYARGINREEAVANWNRGKVEYK